jgi:hypothetical protein
MTKRRKPLLFGFVGSPRENGNEKTVLRFLKNIRAEVPSHKEKGK